MDFRMQPFGSQEVSHAGIRKLLPVFAYHRNMRLSVFALALALATASEPSEELRKAVRGGDIAHARELLEQGVAVNGACGGSGSRARVDAYIVQGLPKQALERLASHCIEGLAGAALVGRPGAREDRRGRLTAG